MKYTILITLILISIQSFAQLGRTKEEIIKEKGYDYKTGMTNDNVPYISYLHIYHSEDSGDYGQTKGYYFKGDICYFEKIIEPSSETNSWVKSLNAKFVKQSDTKWKDYEKRIIYTMSFEGNGEDKTVIISSFYE